MDTKIKKIESKRISYIMCLIFSIGFLFLKIEVLALDIYVSPNGNDLSDGLTKNSPVKSLSAVKEIFIKTEKIKNGETVNVLFSPGRYQGQAILWDVLKEGVAIIFRPMQEGDKVIFDGVGSTGKFFTLRPLKTTAASEAIKTSITIKGFQINNYCEGISFGDYKSNVIVSNNKIEKVTFQNIGSKYDPVKTIVNGKNITNGNCVAAVRIQRSTNNEIIDCKFINIENLPQKQTVVGKYGPLLLHAIYLSDGASKNTIIGNEFSKFTGSPVRIRNESDENEISKNKFMNPIYINTKREYKIKAVSQWYCNENAPGCVNKEDECPSANTLLKNNYIDPNLDGYSDESQSKNAKCPEEKLKVIRSKKEVIME